MAKEYLIGSTLTPSQAKLKRQIEAKKRKEATSLKPKIVKEEEYEEDSRDFQHSQKKRSKIMKKGEELQFFSGKKVKKVNKKNPATTSTEKVLEK